MKTKLEKQLQALAWRENELFSRLGGDADHFRTLDQRQQDSWYVSTYTQNKIRECRTIRKSANLPIVGLL